MNQNQLIQDYESKYLKKEIPSFQIGDTIRVHTRIVEGQKERIQMFAGTVIARKGSGLSESFIVYRNAYGSSMERLFLLHSPNVAKIEVMRKGKVRRAKLNYIRGASGKAAKIEERIVSKTKAAKAEPKTKKAEAKVEKKTESEVESKPEEKTTEK